MKLIVVNECDKLNIQDYDDDEIVNVQEPSGAIVKGHIYKRYDPVTNEDCNVVQYYTKKILEQQPDLISKEHFDKDFVKTLYIGKKNQYSNNEIDNITLEVKKFYEDNLNLQINIFRPIFCDHDMWLDYSKKFHYPGKMRGVCLPELEIALIYNEAKTFITNYFHEYFGHALFFENSRLGKAIKEFTKNDQLNITEMFNIYPDLCLFRFENFNKKKNITCNLEGYAVWTEAMLCEEFKKNYEWSIRKNKLKFIKVFEDEDITYFDLLSFFVTQSNKLTNVGFIKSFFK